MGDNFWSTSSCRPDVWWYGYPGQGSWYWTARFGQHWVGGGVYQTYAASGWECGPLGPPVKDYQFLSEFGNYGTWFQGGAVYFTGSHWAMALGDYGQNANRLAEETAPDGTPRPPEHDEMVTAAARVGPDPTPQMRSQLEASDWIGKRLATDYHGPKA